MTVFRVLVVLMHSLTCNCTPVSVISVNVGVVEHTTCGVGLT